MFDFLNRVKVNIGTTGQGSVTVGSAVSNAFMTPSEAGAEDSKTYRWILEEGFDFEIFDGLYNGNGSPETVDRDNVIVSKISGTVGMTKMTLAGAATLRCIAAAEDFASIKAGTINAQTGTAYTLVLSDQGEPVTMDNGSANTLTIPTNAAVPFETGTVINVVQKGAGTTTIAGDTGVTVNGVSAGSGDIQNQYQGVSLLKVATNTWIASGDIGTVS